LACDVSATGIQCSSTFSALRGVVADIDDNRLHRALEPVRS